MPFGKLDFDLSDDERARLHPRAREPQHIVTPNDRSIDFAAVTRANGDGTPEVYTKKERRDRSVPSSGFRYCCGLLLVLVCIGAIVGVIIAATNASSDDEQTTTTTMSTEITATAPSAVTTPPPTLAIGGGDDGVDIDPLVELTFLCNHQFTDGPHAGLCMAIFSVDNPSGDVVEVEVGANNFVEPGEIDVGQQTVFAAGSRFGGAAFQWDCTANSAARWTLRTGGGTSVATAPNHHVECPAVPRLSTQ